MIALMVLVGVSAGPALSQTVRFVDDSAVGANNGSDWTNAYTDLQVAIDNAVSGDEIWVAQGLYHAPPTLNDGFALKAGIKILGGFTANTATPAERDLDASLTVMTGDNIRKQVFYGAALATETVLDTLTITGGNAAPGTSGSNAEGGGLFAFQCVMTINNCRFVGNHAWNGGGAYVFDGDCTFIDCVFDGNTATNNGGGLYRFGSTGSPLSLEGCLFTGNSANLGGGIDLFNNRPGVDLLNCIFDGNSAANIGGGLRGLSNGMTAVNCLFINNGAASCGGAIATGMNPTGTFGPDIINCTMTGNTTGVSGIGGGICLQTSNGVVTVVNSILWANSDGTGTTESAQLDFSNNTMGDIPDITYSDIDGLVAAGNFDSLGNVNNLGVDPLFNVDYSLTPTSGVIDKGNDSAVPIGVTTDLYGGPRFLDDFVDMGAVESPGIADTDGDGVDDDLDNCPFISNPGQEDVDEDGIGDACDTDNDNDGIDDGLDNCPLTPNPLQTDTDGDGQGDACDNDDDDDGLSDTDEATFLTDPLDPDSDDDGLEDGEEVDLADGTGCPNPLDPDSDDDTLLDGNETAALTDPCSNDTDGDGITDNVDPTPTEPGVPEDFLISLMRDVANNIHSLDLDLFTGRHNFAKRARRNVLASRVRRAARALNRDRPNLAILFLELALNRVDGQPHPPDWMVDSPEKDGVREDLELLLALIAL